MATKSALLSALASAREKKAEKRAATKDVSKDTEDAKRPIETPKAPEPAKPPEMSVITNPQRLLAQECTNQAMIMGWEKAVQKTAYEAGISEHTLKEILDAALEYEAKADPPGKIEGLEDWRHEKRGSSELSSPRR